MENDKDKVINNIFQEIKNNINTKSKVLYLLIEIRKYLERKYLEGCDQRERDKYPNLYFYCNWALHIKMDRTPAKKILKRFESVCSNANNLKEISEIFKEKEKDFYYFKSLKDELLCFLEGTELFDNGSKWFEFKKLLTEILIDCPLVNENARVSKFSYEKREDRQIEFRVKINDIKKLGSFRITLKEKYN